MRRSERQSRRRKPSAQPEPTLKNENNRSTSRFFRRLLGVHDADEIERGLTAFAAEGNGGLIVSPHALTFSNRDHILALAARLRLPTLYPFAFYAKSGGLISYGFDMLNHFQQGAAYVDR